jgi:hypothetical protein
VAAAQERRQQTALGEVTEERERLAEIHSRIRRTAAMRRRLLRQAGRSHGRGWASVQERLAKNEAELRELEAERRTAEKISEGKQ